MEIVGGPSEDSRRSEWRFSEVGVEILGGPSGGSRRSEWRFSEVGVKVVSCVLEVRLVWVRKQSEKLLGENLYLNNNPFSTIGNGPSV